MIRNASLNFVFQKMYIYDLVDAMSLLDVVKCYNVLKVDQIQCTCIFIKMFSYPCRQLNMVPSFARPVPQLCMISNAVMDDIYCTRWNYLLSTFNQPWLSAEKLQIFCDAVFQKSGELQNCLGFVDGAVIPASRPGKNQRVLHNSRKKVYAIKFQSVSVPNGLLANLYGPVEGTRHDSAMQQSLACITNCNN